MPDGQALKIEFTLTLKRYDGHHTPLGRLSLTVADKSGMEVDELTIDIDDSDGQVELPSKGKKITAIFGYKGMEQNRGGYIVDEINHQGPPDIITIRARSADFRQTLLEERETSYHKQTLGGIIATIAKRHGLIPAVAPDLAGIAIPHIDQINESDTHIVTRLAQEHGAVGTVKDGRLIFTVCARPQQRWQLAAHDHHRAPRRRQPQLQ